MKISDVGFTEVEHIEYTRTVVPTSMRSPYWQYFGFPANDDNCILTKKKIVCTICNTIIAYNKNTSNLRTHLVAKHEDILLGMRYQMSDATTTTTTTTVDNIKPTKRTLEDDDSLALPPPLRLKLNNSNFTTATAVKTDHLYLTTDDDDLGILTDGEELEEYQDQPQVTSENDAVDLIDSTVAQSQLSVADVAQFDDFVQDDDEEDDDGRVVAEAVGSPVAQPYNFVDIVPSTTTTTYDNQTFEQQAVIEMLITDLLPISTVCGPGFQQLLLNVPVDKRLLEEKISTQYTQMQSTISAHLEQTSQKFAFSISIEYYRNLEQSNICDIYFNYLTDISVAPELQSVLYYSGSDTDCFDSLEQLNLENCTAIVVSGDAPTNIVNLAMARQYEIPIIDCMESVLTRCLAEIFSSPSIKADFEHIYKSSEQRQQDTLQLPEVYANCPWSKLHYLQFVLDNSMLNGLNDVALSDDLRSFVDYLLPLKIILETLSEEPLPICTLIRPLTVRLYEEHFAVALASSYLSEAKEIVVAEFQKSFIDQKFLSEATFFDVRFRHDFIDADSSSRQLQQSICARFKRLLVLTKVPKPEIKIEQDSSTGKRKSGLKMFFARINDASGQHTNAISGAIQTPAPPQKTTIDLEFDKYKCEPTLDLEQCPISWWHQQQEQQIAGCGHYKQLGKLAAYYLCVPACVNRLSYRYDASERWAWRHKRATLRQQQRGRSSVSSPLWYLHYNRAYYNKLYL